MSAVNDGVELKNFRNVDEVTYGELQTLDRLRCVAVCAVSALEVHGPHLPLGADLHQAMWMADETGRRFAAANPDWTVLRYPPLAIGADELPLPGSVSSPPWVVYRAVMALGRQLAKAGFRYIMITNGHGGPRHAAALESACRRISRKYGISMFTPSIRALHRIVTGKELDRVEQHIGRKLSEDERHGLLNGEHAGTWETSWYLAQHPEWVSPEWKSLEEDHPPRIAWMQRVATRGGDWLEARGFTKVAGQLRTTLEGLAGAFGWLLNSRSGYGRADRRRVSYSGWPAVASPEVGRAYSDLPVEMSLEDLENVVSGKLDAEQVRSIASDAPVIQPWFFPALAAAAAVILALVLS